MKVKIEENLYFNTVTSTYFVQKYMNGIQRTQSTKIKGEVELKDGRWVGRKGLARARAEKTNIITKWKKEKDPKKFRKHSFDEYFDIYLVQQSAKSKNTYRDARVQIDNHLRPWFIEHCPCIKSFDTKAWARYCLAQHAIDKKNRELAKKGEFKGKLPRGEFRLLKHDRKHLIATLNLAYNERVIDRKFGKDNLFLNEGKSEAGRPLEDEEISSLLEAVEESSFHTKVQIYIAIFMGMRKDEILGLPLSEIDTRKKVINIDKERTKTRYGREVQIHDNVWPLLKKLINECKKNNGKFIFPSGISSVSIGADYNKPVASNDTAWDTLRDRAGVNCRFHDLKYTCIKLYKEAGINDLDISHMVGTSLKTIKDVYSKVIKGSKEKAKSEVGKKFLTTSEGEE